MGIGLLTAGIVYDETVRTYMQNWFDIANREGEGTSGNKTQFPIRLRSDYEELSKRWKQLLAEVELNHSEYPPRFIRVLGDLTFADTERIDRLAPYVVGDSLIRSNENAEIPNIPGLLYPDLQRLRTMGILQPGQSGQTITANPNGDKPASVTFRGRALAFRVTTAEAARI